MAWGFFRVLSLAYSRCFCRFGVCGVVGLFRCLDRRTPGAPPSRPLHLRRFSPAELHDTRWNQRCTVRALSAASARCSQDGAAPLLLGSTRARPPRPAARPASRGCGDSELDAPAAANSLLSLPSHFLSFLAAGGNDAEVPHKRSLTSTISMVAGSTASGREPPHSAAVRVHSSIVVTIVLVPRRTPPRALEIHSTPTRLLLHVWITGSKMDDGS